MVLYTEKQLEKCYRQYCLHQIKKDFPFMKLEDEADYERLVELAENTIDFWAENGLEHERCGEMIERIGLVNFLDGIDVEVDPNMIDHPRESSYERMDGWDEEAIKWFEQKRAESVVIGD